MVFTARPQKIKLNHIQNSFPMKNKKINRSVKIKHRNNNQKLADNSLLYVIERYKISNWFNFRYRGSNDFKTCWNPSNQKQFQCWNSRKAQHKSEIRHSDEGEGGKKCKQPLLRLQVQRSRFSVHFWS